VGDWRYLLASHPPGEYNQDMKHTIKTIKLNRGSDLLVVNAPNTSFAGFSIGVRAGYNYAPCEKTELAHLLEHLMFEANQTYPDGDELAYQLERNGAEHNGHTGPIYMDFEYSFAKEYTIPTIKLALAQLMGPIFKENLVKKEKEIIKKELGPLLDDPYEPCSYNLRDSIYEGATSVSARIRSLGIIDIKDLRRYYKKYFVAENTKFLLYGDFSNTDIKKYVDELNSLLRGYPRGVEQSLRHKALKKYSKKIVAQNSKRAERNCLDFSLVNPSYPVEISPAVKVFYAIYNKGTYSKMFRRIRSEGIGYGFRSGYTMGKNFSELYFYNKSGAKDSLRLFDVALEELTKTLKGDVTSKEFDRAKGYIIGELEKKYNTAADLAHWYIGDFADGDSMVEFKSYLQSVKYLKLADVIGAGNKFIITDGRVLSLLGPDVKKQAGEYEKILKKHLG
jgi:predicted Zn-dependent peptidase